MLKVFQITSLLTFVSTFAILLGSVSAQESLITIENSNPEELYQKELLYFKTANEYLKNKEFEKALIEFRKIRMTNPLHLKVDESIKECRINLGKWVAPDTETDEVWVEIDPYKLGNLPEDRRDSVFEVARGLEKEERYRNAEQIMTQLVQLEPTNVKYKEFYTYIVNKIETIKKSLFEIGQEFYKRGLYAQALKEWYKTLFYSPEDNLLLSNIQNAEAKLKELRQYYIAQMALLESQGKENELLVMLNNAFHQFPTDEVFKNTYDAIQEKREQELNSSIDAGQTFYLQGDFENAEKIFTELLALYPNNLTIAKWNKSIEAAKKKRALDQQVLLFTTTISDLLKEGKLSQAELQFKQLVELAPYDPAVSRMTQLINEQKEMNANNKRFAEIVNDIKQAINSGRIEKAQALLKQADAIKPGSEIVKRLAIVIEKKNSVDTEAIKSQIAKAEQLFRDKKLNEAEAALPKNTGVKELDDIIKQLKRNIRKELLRVKPVQQIQHAFLAGISSYRMGDYRKALAYWESVITLDPNHKQAGTYIKNVQKKISVLEGR